jgi:hypothetical protein
MSTTLLDRTAQTVRGNRTRAIVGLGVLLVLVGAAAAVLLWTKSDATPPGSRTPALVDVHLAEVPRLPRGATECPLVYPDLTAPFDRGARGTPATSCGFVEQARTAYAKSSPGTGPRQIRVPSPATYKWYDLVCTPTGSGSYVTCTGGAGAVIYLYNHHA